MSPTQRQRRLTVPRNVKAAIRRRRLLMPLWYVGPLEEEEACDHNCIPASRWFHSGWICVRCDHWFKAHPSDRGVWRRGLATKYRNCSDDSKESQ